MSMIWALLLRVKSSDPQKRRDAVREMTTSSLKRLRKAKVVDALVKALHDPDDEVRRLVADGLANSDAPRAVEPLTQALKDRDEEVRANAAFALGALRDARGVGPLIAAAHGASPAVRKRVVEALSHIGSGPRVFEHLVDSLRDPDESVREMAISKLSGRFDFEEATSIRVKLLTPLLSEPGKPVRIVAGHLLSRLGSPEAHQALADCHGEVREMTDEERLALLERLCAAYADDDTPAIRALEPRAVAIGVQLQKRGGKREMSRIFDHVTGVRGAGKRNLDMLWDGIGEWRG